MSVARSGAPLWSLSAIAGSARAAAARIAILFMSILLVRCGARAGARQGGTSRGKRLFPRIATRYARPLEPRARVGLASRGDVAVAGEVQLAVALAQRRQQGGEDFVLRLGERNVVRALQLDADG